jgi:hypothetical protein
MPNLTITIIYVALAILIGVCGREQRFGFWGYFFVTLLLTPIMGLLLLVATGGGKTRTKS